MKNLLARHRLTARNAAMLTVNPIPGQKSRNSDCLLKNGAAIRANNLATLRLKLCAPKRPENRQAASGVRCRAAGIEPQRLARTLPRAPQQRVNPRLVIDIEPGWRRSSIVERASVATR